MKRLLVTVAGLRWDHMEWMPHTRSWMDSTHDRCFSTHTEPEQSLRDIMTAGTDHSVVEECTHSRPSLLSSVSESPDEFRDTGINPRESSVIDSLRQMFGVIIDTNPDLNDFLHDSLVRGTSSHEWWTWIHVARPEIPWDPPAAGRRASRISNKIMRNGKIRRNVDAARQLYRDEVIYLDRHLKDVWSSIDNKTRAIICGTNGLRLGPNQWGRDVPHPETTRVPLMSRNVRDHPKVISTLDLLSLMCNDERGHGSLNRQLAHGESHGYRWVTDGDRWTRTDEEEWETWNLEDGTREDRGLREEVRMTH